MSSYVDCIPCIVNKTEKLAEKYAANKQQKLCVMQQILREISECSFEKSAPYVDAKAMRVIKRECAIDDPYLEEKRYYTQALLALEHEMEGLLDTSTDRFLDAMKIALAGNIIDFSGLPCVEFGLVKRIIDDARNQQLNPDTVRSLRRDLKRGGKLLYLGDNAGEIVLDKIFIKEIRREYPDVAVTFATRGAPIYNDVTQEDAYLAGMDKAASIIGNGSDIPGTDLNEVSRAFHQAFTDADIIISKGQGNFETLLGCGYNVYYLFLCKCNVFINKLGAKQFDSIFVNDRAI